MRTLLIPSLLLLLVGCGGSGGQTINGKISFTDGAPLSRGVVVLVSEEFSYRGVVTPDGSYEVLGVQSGTYNVAITGTSASTSGGDDNADGMAWDQDTGQYLAPPPAEAGTGGSKKSDGPANLLAAKYSKADESGLTLTVPGDYTLTVDSP